MLTEPNPTDSAAVAAQRERDRLRTRERDRIKLCKCHPTSSGHRFGDDLACGRFGCIKNWFQHLANPEACRGGLLPPHLRGRKPAARAVESEAI